MKAHEMVKEICCFVSKGSMPFDLIRVVDEGVRKLLWHVSPKELG
jgi:hypothetical protein